MKRSILALPPQWSLSKLYEHFQGALELELWTIPYYLTILYSIIDPTSTAYRLVQSVAYQEMLHLQLMSNVANAYGYSPTLQVPTYVKENVPHVNFDLDTPNPTTIFTPFSAELGPLDEKRVNTICLVEYPLWCTEREPDLSDTQEEYGSIAEFYNALRVGMGMFQENIKGNLKQVDEFGPFYQNCPCPLTITEYSKAGFKQAMMLIDIIVDQGEGQTQSVKSVPLIFQNTADDFRGEQSHFQKFESIRNMSKWPETYTGVTHPAVDSLGYKAQQVLIADFAKFLDTLNSIFRGEPMPPAFGVQMAKLGGDVLNCWQNNAIPRFS